jgi:parallel beta-helix repeat protein
VAFDVRDGTPRFVAADGTAKYERIQAAIDDAGGGDRITVADGTYDESVLADVPEITITAAADADPVVSPSREHVGVAMTADGVSIAGLTIENADDGVFTTASSLSIAEVTITAPEDKGIEIDKPSRGITITDSEITNADDDGIQVREDVRDFSVANSDITGSGDEGILFGENAAGVEIRSNTIADTANEGIEFFGDCRDTTIADNTFRNNGDGDVSPADCR